MTAGLRDADAAFVAALEAAHPGLTSPAAPADLEEPRGRFAGRATAVVRPRDAAEVAAVLRAAGAARVPLVPRGGGTGLVGGQVSAAPVPLILSLERMRGVRALDADDNVLVIEAGATLQAARDAAAKVGRLFPLSLASQGSATVGGILATNAGGVSALRWGTARALVLGVEAVLADGSVHHGLTRLVKDNTGYDLRGLLVGSEGTLGVITAAALRLAPAPAETATALAAVPSPGAALALLRRLRAGLGETLSACELISGVGLDFLASVGPEVRLPLGRPDWSVLIEADAGAGAGLAARAEAVLAAALEAGEAEDVRLAANGGQRAAFWTVRERIPEANKRVGAIASHDIAVPTSAVPGFIAEAGAALAALDPALRVNAFGHLGDGNLHYNVFPPEGGRAADHAAQRARVTRTVHDLVAAAGGSISAEHGIGRAKVGELARYGDPAKLAAIAAIKRALDPAGVLNPGAVVPVAGWVRDRR